jgi:carboxypeptidase T
VPYLTADGIDDAIQYLASQSPSICQAIVLPEPSVEGRTCRALKIAAGTGGNRRAVLFLGGLHAREIINPDLLIRFAFDLCSAYGSGGGLQFGNQTFSAAFVKLIVESLDIYIFPLVNPDGRAYVQAPGGDVWWRKNRSYHPASNCYGVDINRNFDFQWPSGIGTSANPCDYQIYKGPSAFSEPETRNVRWLLDVHPNIMAMIDIHSYDNDLLYPWGDGPDQETSPGGQDYLPPADLDWYTSVGNSVQSAIRSVRGTAYSVKQSIQLYPTSGTSMDYAFSRSFVNSKDTKVYAYTLETGTEFQPTYTVALPIMNEVAAGLVQFCIECVCAITGLAGGTELEDRLDRLRAFRDQELVATEAGAVLARSLVRHGAELTALLITHPALRDRAFRLLVAVEAAVSQDAPLEAGIVTGAQALAAELAERSSPELRDTLAAIITEAGQFTGRTIRTALQAAVG